MHTVVTDPILIGNGRVTTLETTAPHASGYQNKLKPEHDSRIYQDMHIRHSSIHKHSVKLDKAVDSTPSKEGFILWKIHQNMYTSKSF